MERFRRSSKVVREDKEPEAKKPTEEQEAGEQRRRPSG